MDWVEDNQDNLLQSILKSHLETALAHDVSTFLGRYLNVCVRALCTAGLKVPRSKTECSLEHIISDILCGPYQGVTHLPPPSMPCYLITTLNVSAGALLPQEVPRSSISTRWQNAP